jgi:lysophospholipase L1-like esterase
MKNVLFTVISILFVTCFLTAEEPSNEGAGKIAVMGSSVAAGWVTSHEGKYDMKNGYAFRLERQLAPLGYDVVNISMPGDTTDGVLKRMEKDLYPLKPDYVIIGLSMANEGIEEKDPDEVFNHYEKGLKKIMDRCRDKDIIPIVGLCYGCDTFEEKHYRYIKTMNLLINTWDVPSINFLGALDDGSGHFPEGYTYDPSHPDNRGHEELFYSIVPSLFQALEQGKALPSRPDEECFVTVESGRKGLPLSFVPADVIHSFAMAFSVRTPSLGAIAGIRTTKGDGLVKIARNGKLEYTSVIGKKVGSRNKIADGKWHHVALSHRCLQGETLLFVDGELAGTVEECLEPQQFVLGSAPESEKGRPETADYRNWMVFRSSLNEEEVNTLHEGKLLQASLELYAPLRQEEPAPDCAVGNLAQSLSKAVAYPSAVKSDLAVIREKQVCAAKDRANELRVKEKVPAKVDPKIYDAYVGKYKSRMDGLINTILKEQDRLYLSHEYMGRIELHPESESKFFIKFPLAEITVTFEKDKRGRADRFVLRQGEMEDVAVRAE